MPKRSFVDRISVKDPCSQDWETMKGNDRVRFCDHCAKNVNNLSTVTRKEAKRIVRGSGGNICIRYIKHPETGQPVYLDQFIQLRRRAPLIAAGVVSASMSLSSLSYAQGGAVRSETAVEASRDRIVGNASEEDRPGKDVKRGVVRGTIVDPNGAVIPGAIITLTGDKVSEIRRVISNAEGEYRIENILPGRYIMQVEVQGFAEFTSSVVIPDGNLTTVDVPLNVGPIEVEVEITLDAEQEVATVGGAMVIEYTNALVRAAADGDLVEVRALLAKGENVNGDPKEDEETTPLAAAVENGHIEIARLLLVSGAEVDRADSGKRTPLMMLDDGSTAAMAALLLSFGADIHQRDDEGNTALILAAEYVDAEVVEALLKGNPDVNAANDDGQTALMNAAYEDDLEIVRVLIKAGAEVNAKNDDGETAFDLTGDNEIEALLIAHGAVTGEQGKDTDDPNDDEEPPVKNEPTK
jgi:ankyrin repeat protein